MKEIVKNSRVSRNFSVAVNSANQKKMVMMNLKIANWTRSELEGHFQTQNSEISYSRSESLGILEPKNQMQREQTKLKTSYFLFDGKNYKYQSKKIEYINAKNVLFDLKCNFPIN